MNLTEITHLLVQSAMSFHDSWKRRQIAANNDTNSMMVKKPSFVEEEAENWKTEAEQHQSVEKPVKTAILLRDCLLPAVVENVQQKTITHPKQNTDSNNNVIAKATVEESLLEIARLAEEHAKQAAGHEFDPFALLKDDRVAHYTAIVSEAHYQQNKWLQQPNCEDEDKLQLRALQLYRILRDFFPAQFGFDGQRRVFRLLPCKMPKWLTDMMIANKLKLLRTKQEWEQSEMNGILALVRLQVAEGKARHPSDDPKQPAFFNEHWEMTKLLRSYKKTTRGQQQPITKEQLFDRYEKLQGAIFE